MPDIQEHTCQAVAVHCIDFRFQKQVSAFLEKKFPQGYDRIAVAGGIKDLLENQTKGVVFKNLKISIQLHQPKTIFLMQHEDCGAYGGSTAFQSPRAEREFQAQQLQKTQKLLARYFAQDIETSWWSI